MPEPDYREGRRKILSKFLSRPKIFQLLTHYSDLDDHTIREYKEVYDSFFEERHLIPNGRFHEVCFESLEADPIGQMRGIYEALALPDFQVVEPAIKQYVESLAGYSKNEFPDLSVELKTRIAREWRRCFEEWGYPTSQ